MIATEAPGDPDDLTARVAQQMQGAGQDSDVAAAGAGDRTEDLTQVDGIYNDAVAANDETAQDTADNGGTTDEPPIDDTGDEAPAEDTGDAGGEDSPIDADDSEGDTGDPLSDEEEIPASVFSDKNTLKKNVIYFGNIIKTNLETLNTMIGRLDDLNDIRCCNQVISNLQHIQDYIYTMLTEEFSAKPYEDLMTKYVTLKRVYDVSVEMLSKHFNKDGKRKSPINPRRSQRKIV